MFTLAELDAAAEIVYRFLDPTPQYAWPLLAERAGCEVWVKHENHTPIGSFKVRGGLVYMERLKQSQSVDGVICATRGNHGQSVAYGARRHGLPSVIVVPHGNSRSKNAAMRSFGGELIEHGDDFQDAYERAFELAEERNLHMVRSFDRGLSLGIASSPLELMRAVPDLDVLYAPIGLGSTICSCVAARDALGAATRIVGVVAERAPTYALSFAAGKVVDTESCDTFADGLAVRHPDEDSLRIILDGVERVITVTEEQIAEAIAIYATDTHNMVEGAGAASLAALLQEKAQLAGKKAGVMLTGGNIDLDVYLKALGGAS